MKIRAVKIKEISKRILQGDFSFLSLFKTTNKDQSLHPAELAKVLATLPNDAALKAYGQLPQPIKVSVFAYLDIQQQKFLVKKMPAALASTVLNSLSSDDRLIFLSEFKGVELSHFIELLDEKKQAGCA